MTLSLLVVDDVPAIAEGFAMKFKRISQEEFQVPIDIRILGSSDEVVSYLSDSERPSLDLIFTDIDLAGNNDRSGIAIARFAKTSMPSVPRVGCSGKFLDNDLSEDDRALFDKWWPKTRTRSDLPEIARDVIRRAMAHHNQRLSGVSGFSAQRRDVPTPQTHEEFKNEGFSRRVIEPTEQSGIAEPFAVWVRSGSDGYEMEVVGCRALFSCGDTYEDAEGALIENIKELSLIPEELGAASSVQKAKAFSRTVTGKR